MYEQLSDKIAGWCCGESREKDTEYEVVSYGLSVILENTVKMVVLLGIGMGLGQFKETLILLFSFCKVRIHA